MNTEVWMDVSSISTMCDDEIAVHYIECVDKIVVHLGSGRLFMALPFAEELFEKLREALQDGALTQAEISGSGLWLTATEFVPAEDVSNLRSKAVA